MLQEGVIGIPPPKALGLCAGMTNAPYATTTEVYPDSPQANGAQCNAAQVDPYPEPNPHPHHPDPNPIPN